MVQKSKTYVRRVQQTYLRDFSDVILYVGGNDVSGRKPLETLRQELHDVVLYLLDQHCRVHLCTVCSRTDVDVRPLNELWKICGSTGANMMACYNSFIYGNGRTVLHNYNRDGIHLVHMVPTYWLIL